jgi:hypothetical protein
MNRMLCMIMFCTMMTGIAHADFLDEFNNPVLDPGWRIANEDSLHWSLVDRPGFLRIQSQFFYSQPVNFFYHVEAITGNFDVSTRIIARPDSAGQGAVITADYDSFFTSPHAIIGLGNVMGLGEVVFTVFDDTIIGGAFYADTLVYLRLRTNSDTVIGEFSANDTDWAGIGSYYDSRFHELQAVGLSALNSSQFGGTPQTPEMNADFDWFHLVALTSVEEWSGSSPTRACGPFAKPNPFVSYTRITGCGERNFAVYDALGRKVAVQSNSRIGEGLMPGIYFVRQSEAGAAAVRIVKIK